MLGWCVGIATTLLVLLIYLAYFFKFNWVKDMRNENKMKRSTKKMDGIFVESKNRKLGKLPPVYPNGWFVLLQSSQLKRGQVKHVSALGENFAVFRTEKGVVNILDAYCPHLGANMGEGGRVRGECLECPFHSWTFRGDGFCDNIPYTEKVPHIARVKSWKCCEVNHLIFVWYHAESAEPDWQPQPHAYISSGVWQFQGRNEFLISCHIQEIPENGADFAHLSAVHGPAMFFSDSIPWLARHSWTDVVWRQHCSHSNEASDDETINKPSTEATEVRVKLNSTSSVEPISNGHVVDHVATATTTENIASRKGKHKANMQMRHNLVLLERFTLLSIRVNVEQIGPGYVELLINTSFGSMYILQTVTPIEPLLQRVTHQIFSPPWLAPYAKLIFLGECLMFERDVAIWNHKKFERQPILVREDRTILAYRRWYSQFYSANSPTYQMATKNLLW